MQNLNKAALQANPKDLKYLVSCGEQIDEKASIFGAAPIHKAIQSAENAIKQQALDAIVQDCNANVNNIDSNGWSPLHHACYIGDLQSTQFLIKNGAEVSAYSNQKRTPLHFAAMNKHTDVVQELLSHGADLEWPDEIHCTPLHLACKKGSIESVHLLLLSGANVYAVDERKWSALHYAAYNGHPRVCNLLLKWEADRDELRDFRTT
jgi:ankyrin repeat protein